MGALPSSFDECASSREPVVVEGDRGIPVRGDPPANPLPAARAGARWLRDAKSVLARSPGRRSAISRALLQPPPPFGRYWAIIQTRSFGTGSHNRHRMNLPVPSWSRKWPLSAHPPRCCALQRRSPNRTHSRRSASGAGTGLYAPYPPFASLQGRTQLRLVEVAVVVDPAANARVVHLGQVLQGVVAAMMKRPTPNCSADGRQRFRTGGGQEARKGPTSPPQRFPRSERKPEKVKRLVGKSPWRFASLQ
jgi:hypothetical protein